MVDLTILIHPEKVHLQYFFVRFEKKNCAYVSDNFKIFFFNFGEKKMRNFFCRICSLFRRRKQRLQRVLNFFHDFIPWGRPSDTLAPSFLVMVGGHGHFAPPLYTPMYRHSSSRGTQKPSHVCGLGRRSLDTIFNTTDMWVR